MAKTLLALLWLTILVHYSAARSSVSASFADLEDSRTRDNDDSSPAPVESPSPAVATETDSERWYHRPSTPALSTHDASSGSSTLDIMTDTTVNGSTTIPPNWVGPTIGDITDTACYRKKHKTNSNGECSLGYNINTTGRSCWAQCPIAYPVKCFAECIPQNDDCALNVLAKVTNTGFVVFNAATLGVFSAIYKSFKSLKTGLVCVMNLFNIAEGISRYMRFRQTMAINGTKEEIMAALFQTDMFLVDLPVVVTACLGYETPMYARVADVVITAVETMVKQFIINKELIMSSAKNFLKFLSTTVVGNVTKGLDPESVSNITSLIESGSTCGYQLKKVTDRVVDMVNKIREDKPEATNEDIRTIMSSSKLALKIVPTVTNNCMGELLATKTTLAAYQTRDVLRKTIGVIIDQLIETSTTDMGEAMAKQDYMIKVANMGFQGLSAIDPLGIAYMTFHFVQPICGPTEFLGEIDDGSLTDALGLTTMDDAFHGSYGEWTQEGDGIVSITFVSTDTKDVKVVIHSGGEKFATVCVGAGETVQWKSTVALMQDKTMYLDRWRPGFLGLPGSGGGSLLLWVPRSSHGGHLEMTVKINVS